MAYIPCNYGSSGGTTPTLLYSSNETSTSGDGTSSTNMVTVNGCLNYNQLLVYVAQGNSASGLETSNMNYTDRWHVSGGTMEILYPTTSGVPIGKFMVVLKIIPTSDTILMYCTAVSESGRRKFYVLGF